MKFEQYSNRKSILEQFKEFYVPGKTTMKEVMDFIGSRDYYYKHRFEDLNALVTEKDAHDMVEFYRYFKENLQTELEKYQDEVNTDFEIYIFQQAEEILMKHQREEDQKFRSSAKDWQRIEANRLTDQLFEMNEELTLQMHFPTYIYTFTLPNMSTIQEKKERDSVSRNIRLKMLQWVLEGEFMAVEYPDEPFCQITFITINKKGRWEPMTQELAELTGTLSEYRTNTDRYACYKEFSRKLSTNVFYLTELNKLRVEDRFG